MPSVLIELGYITNPSEEQYLLSESGSSALAKSIYQAFLAYKQEGRQGNVIESGNVVETKKEEPPVSERSEDKKPQAKAQSAQPVFKIQILTSDRVLPVKSRLFKAPGSGRLVQRRRHL